MSKEEGNKLIAEFMGLEPFENPFRNITKEDGLYKRKNADETTDIIGDLNYHSSWDWLMPVVEKIEALVIPKGFIDYDFPERVTVTIYSCTCWITVGDNHKIFNQNGDIYKQQEAAESKIMAVWKAICFFIKWYNEAKIKNIMKDEAKYGNRAWE